MRTRGRLSSFCSPLTVVRVFLLLFGFAGGVLRTTAQTSPVAPLIVKQPLSQRLDYGQTLLLTVEAAGTGPLTYVWRNYAGVLPQSTPYFTLEHASTADSGQYTVTVSNAAGSSVSAIAYVIVAPATPPVFSQQPVGQSVVYDESFQLSAAVSGASPTTYSWFKDGTPLNVTTPTLSITHATTAQSGNYTVVATNPGGTTTSDAAVVRVFDPLPPVIAQQPQSAVANSSEVVTFTVGYTQTGVGPLKFQWYHDGATIPGATNATLTIGYPPDTAYGDYTVTITGAGGSVTSQPAHLGPRPLLPQWVSLPTDVAARIGERAVMSVGQVYGTEPILYQWLKDGTAIAGANGLTYVIPSVTAADYGSYALQVSNIVGARTSLPTRLVPPSSPAITIVRQPESHVIGVNGNQGPLLSVAATTTSGGLTYDWYFNGFRYGNSTGATLTAYSNPWMAGLYQVVVTNGTARALSEPAILASEYDLGTRAALVAGDIQHANGNLYDQFQLGGSVTTVAAAPGKISRCSFLDLNNDIVQVEFSGAGSLTLRVVGSASQSAATLYNQPNVRYTQGHVALTIANADESTHLAVFTVGPLTALNQALFQPDVSYDGVADLAYVAILSRNGKFGSLRLANTHFFATLGFTGVYAPGIDFAGPVNLGDIEASDTAVPLLCVGSAPEIRIAGGSLRQANAAPIHITTVVPLTFTDGVTSHNRLLPVQPNAARFEKDGEDVTTLLAP